MLAARTARKGLIAGASVILLAAALFTSVAAVDESVGRLVRSGRIVQALGGPKTQVSCANAMFATGAKYIYATAAWWALFGFLRVVQVQWAAQLWSSVRVLAKYAGSATGALVVALYVLPAVAVFVVFFLIPLLAAGAFGLLWLLRPLFQALG